MNKTRVNSLLICMIAVILVGLLTFHAGSARPLSSIDEGPAPFYQTIGEVKSDRSVSLLSFDRKVSVSIPEGQITTAGYFSLKPFQDLSSRSQAGSSMDGIDRPAFQFLYVYLPFVVKYYNPVSAFELNFYNQSRQLANASLVFNGTMCFRSPKNSPTGSTTVDFQALSNANGRSQWKSIPAEAGGAQVCAAISQPGVYRFNH